MDCALRKHNKNDDFVGSSQLIREISLTVTTLGEVVPVIVTILSFVLKGSFSSPSWNLQPDCSDMRLITTPPLPITAAEAILGMRTRIV